MSHPLRIQRHRTKGYRLPEGAVYVGRPTKWGNPFLPGEKDPQFGCALTRLRCVMLYRNLLLACPAALTGTYGMPIELVRQWERMAFVATKELRGKLLACWCPLDRECHADILAEIANR